MKKLEKLIKDLNRIGKGYQDFEMTVKKFLKWYNIPLNWTKSDLHAFYFNHGGRI